MHGKENKSGDVLFSYLPVTSDLIDNGCQNEIWCAANEKEIRWTIDIISRLLWQSRQPAAAERAGLLSFEPHYELSCHFLNRQLSCDEG